MLPNHSLLGHRTLHPRLEILKGTYEPAQQCTKGSPEPTPDRIPRNKVNRRGHTNPSQRNLAGPRHAQQPRTDSKGALHPKLSQLRRGLDHNAVGIALDDLRGGGGPGRHVEELVDGALPLVPLRRTLVLGLAHLAEVLGDLLALLLGDAAEGVARRPRDAHA